jgi:hypothetical protein
LPCRQECFFAVALFFVANGTSLAQTEARKDEKKEEDEGMRD